ncbi:ABC transporter permease [Kitasatospora sp. NPDC097691]|uniref:ABC transporter permease n=1 Tax=Kitasatospora sp. NPDC097691 TaxID=3157231 RepID=UPI0033185F97
MNAPRTLRAGLHRGGLEIRHILRSKREWFSHLSLPFIFLVFAGFTDHPVPGTTVPAAQLVIAGGLASLVSLTGITTLAQILASEREDGTLLRMRGTPGGMPAYLLGKVCVVGFVVVVGTAVLLVGGALFIGSPLPGSVGQWATLVWVLGLGLVAASALGAAVGAVLPNPREALAVVMIPLYGLVAISGVFFPTTVMPRLLQRTADVFPIKWMAQGVRSAIMPDGAAVAEAAGGWQHPATFGVLAAWCVLGLALAPRLLLRMARKESGSRLAERRLSSTAAPAR